MSGTAELVAQRIAARQGEFAVIGLARSGIAVSALLKRAGFSVYASDSLDGTSQREAVADLRRQGVDAEAGRHDLERISRAAVAVVSPGVPPSAAPVASARKAGVPVVSEVEIGLRLTPSLRYIAVTGTNGKSTTTALIAHILKAVGGSAAAAGNIGIPVSSLALMEKPPLWAALELSSFQLHDTPGLYPDAGVLTNLSPDHLDRYDSVQEYYGDKRLLFANAVEQSHWVVNGDCADSMRMMKGVAGHLHLFSTSLSGTAAWYDRASDSLVVLDRPLMKRSRLALMGDHNVANALAAALSVMVADPKHQTESNRELIAAAIESFRSLAHRLEPVADKGGILWINDSKATNVSSTMVALAGMTRPTVVLLGGKHKGEPYFSLIPELQRVAKHVIAYGAATELIVNDLGDRLFGRVPVDAMPEASFESVMKRARSLAVPGDVVLLSPACSSYDMFHDYEERGREFARIAELLT